MRHTKHEAKNWHESKRSCKSESVSRREIERSIKKSSSKIKLLSWSLSSHSQVSTATWISFMKMCFLFSFGIEPEGIAKQYPLRMWVVRDKKIKFKMCEKSEFHGKYSLPHCVEAEATWVPKRQFENLIICVWTFLVVYSCTLWMENELLW